MMDKRSKQERDERKRGGMVKEEVRKYPRAPDGPRTESAMTGVLTQKSMRDLVFGSIKVSGDPYTTPIGADTPYPLTTVRNRLVDATYKGVPNLNGNVLVAIDDPSNARLTKVYDAAYTEVVMNYLYCNRPGDKSQGMNFLLGNSIDNALAVLDAKLVRDLPFVTDHWETNMTNIDAQNRLAPIILDQAVTMNIISAVQAYNTIMAIRESVAQMAWMREAPKLRSLFSLLAKKAVMEQVNLSAANLPGSYVDMDWYRMVAGITAVPSRKANDRLDPLLSINATHWLPEVKEYRNYVSEEDKGTLVFDSTTVTTNVNTTTYGIVQNATIQQVARMIQEMLSPVSILQWARQRAFGTTDRTEQSYVNDITNLYQALQLLAARFADYFGVVRTMYTYLSDTTGNAIRKNGIVKLTDDNGFVASIQNDVPLVYNMLAANLFRAVTCGPADMEWDENSSAWTFFSLWDRYTGVPEFEKMSGGAFLTYSVRDLPERGSGENGTEQKWQFPVLFTATGNAKFVDRNGASVTVTREKLTADQINNSNKFSRLQLGNYGLTGLFVPYYDWAKAALDPLSVSWLNHALLTVYGMGHQHRDDTIIVGDNTVDDYDMETSIIGAVDMEQVSMANAMTTFARSQAPLMVQFIPSDTGTIGFR